MFGPKLVGFSSLLAEDKLANLVHASILVDLSDYVGIRYAAQNLAEDFARVTAEDPSPLLEVDTDNYDKGTAEDVVIIIGTIESSRLVRALISQKQLDVEGIRGKWESFCTAVVDKPTCVPGCRKAFVIAGSDKRGAIFGTYTLSEQIGVSPYVSRQARWP
jgi:hypothetical protein